MSEIKKSDAPEREWSGGAVRDNGTGKGRFDLVPLAELAAVFGAYDAMPLGSHSCGEILQMMDDWRYGEYIDSLGCKTLADVLAAFCYVAVWTPARMALEVAKHYEDGLTRYPKDNWRQGIPCSSFYDSACRHLCKWADGWTDEPHDGAFVWNVLGLMWTVNIYVDDEHPELFDL